MTQLRDAAKAGTTMKITFVAIAIISAATMLPLPPLHTAANARGLGFSAAAFRFPGHFHPGRFHPGRFHAARLNFGRYYGAYNAWGLYGGGFALPPYEPENIMAYPAPETVLFVPELPPKLNCQRSQQIMTVPSEDGGTRQVTITRC